MKEKNRDNPTLGEKASGANDSPLRRLLEAGQATAIGLSLIATGAVAHGKIETTYESAKRKVMELPFERMWRPGEDPLYD